MNFVCWKWPINRLFIRTVVRVRVNHSRRKKNTNAIIWINFFNRFLPNQIACIFFETIEACNNLNNVFIRIWSTNLIGTRHYCSYFDNLPASNNKLHFIDLAYRSFLINKVWLPLCIWMVEGFCFEKVSKLYLIRDKLRIIDREQVLHFNFHRWANIDYKTSFNSLQRQILDHLSSFSNNWDTRNVNSEKENIMLT